MKPAVWIRFWMAGFLLSSSQPNQSKNPPPVKEAGLKMV
jgi:hypothetical protein